MIPRFHYDLRPSGTLTEYRLHLSNKIYMNILYEYSTFEVNKIYVTEVRSNIFWPSQLKADYFHNIFSLY